MYLPYFKIEILTTNRLNTLLSFKQLGPELCQTFSDNHDMHKIPRKFFEITSEISPITLSLLVSCDFFCLDHSQTFR